MKHLKTFEKYNFSDVNYTKNGRNYFFDSEIWSYKVGISDNVNRPLYPYVGFKAKKIDDVDYNYDMSVITNDSVYQVMDTIKEILNYDYNNNNNEGYKFSFTGDKQKAGQRLNLYMRMLEESWNIDYDEENNQYFLTKDNHIKTFERYSDEIHEPKVNLAYIKSLSDTNMNSILDDTIEDIGNVEDNSYFFEDDRYDNSLSALKSLRDELMSYNSENDKITLYRVLNADSEFDIRKDKLGEHYTISPNQLDTVTLFDIGVDAYAKMYLIEIKVRIGDINMKKTIQARIEYPHEMEISLLTDKNIEIISIKEFKPSK